MSVPPKYKDHLLVEIDGPEVTPKNIDSRAALELASAYLDLVMKVAEEEGYEFSMTGLEVIDKCAAVAMKPSDHLLARTAAQKTNLLVAGAEELPYGFNAPVTRVRTAIRALPDDQHAKVAVGSWHKRIDAAPRERDVPPEATMTLRAEVLKLGGLRPGVRFHSESERKDFTLLVTKEGAQELGKFLYSEVSITARVRRDEEGNIESGTLTEFRPLETGDDERAWRDWFENQRDGWKEVKDIEAELGRRGD